jgi:hypothetical protein
MLSKNKSLIPFSGVIIILLIAGAVYLLNAHFHHHSDDTKTISSGEIIDLTKIDPNTQRNRFQLLRSMTDLDKEYFAQNQSYYLDDSDPSSKVLIGTYGADELGKEGGIIMLKQLPNGKYSIYWEITSPMFYSSANPRKELKDINGDGLKELITYWNNNTLGDNQHLVTEFWILTLNPKDGTYRVLNPVID